MTEMSACEAAHYRFFDDWQALDISSKAYLVAHYLILQMIQNHKEDAQSTALQRKGRKGSYRKR